MRKKKQKGIAIGDGSIMQTRWDTRAFDPAAIICREAYVTQREIVIRGNRKLGGLVIARTNAKQMIAACNRRALIVPHVHFFLSASLVVPLCVHTPSPSPFLIGSLFPSRFAYLSFPLPSGHVIISPLFFLSLEQ